MARRSRRRVSGFRHIRDALRAAGAAGKPVAFVVAGHNGSGKSTLWYDRLAPKLRIPLVNADRLTLSILPPTDARPLPPWARTLRDGDERWQSLSQQGVQLFTGLIMAQQMAFAFETVFSHWKEHPGGRVESKADVIRTLQGAGYFVVLLFVGLVSADLSILRVETRKQQGGHAVPLKKLRERFPRTQKAIAHAAPLADLTLMFDNSRDLGHAFALARAQQGTKVLYDCREDPTARALSSVASLWLPKVAPHSEKG